MSKVCEITGKGPLYGKKYAYKGTKISKKTKRIQLPNLQKKRIWDEEKKAWVTMRVSAKALRTLDKKGIKVLG